MAVTRHRHRRGKRTKQRRSKRSKKTRRYMKKMRGGEVGNDLRQDIKNAKHWLIYIAQGEGREEYSEEPDFNPKEFIEYYRTKITPNVEMIIDETIRKQGESSAIKKILMSLERRLPSRPMTVNTLSRSNAMKNSDYFGPSSMAHHSAYKPIRNVNIDTTQNKVHEIPSRYSYRSRN